MKNKVMSAARVRRELTKKTRFAYVDLDMLTPRAGIYALWSVDKTRPIYIGRASEKTHSGLCNRLKNHYSGDRGNDRFCLLAYDSFVKKKLQNEGADITRRLNEATQKWIRKNVLFTRQPIEQSEKSIRAIETELRMSMKPILNRIG